MVIKKIRKEENLGFVALLGILTLILLGFISTLYAQSVPEGPTGIESVSNETKTATAAQIFNISGGFISTFNLTTNTQNQRWKGFIGNVTGQFTLDDASGSTLFDWSLSTSVTGNIYTTRNSTTVNWSGINCSNSTHLEAENVALEHNNTEDNITATFNLSGTHDSFFVGSVFISANSCPTLNTYQNSASQDSVFEEMALFSSPSTIVYTTIMEEDVIGFDGSRYDFQMIVPENGNSSWTGATAYYIYIELT